MPTPSIQTLRTDAQQVLNLDSISAVRSVVAATLANANAGTPLNPNLTTQQLWNEFYQIVTQPKSDIESIIANQLMKFMYAPPAPGGAGANGQVIFNDGGVLAGDAGLTYNKTTDALTITGDLTVDTNVLKVDSTGNAVGIGSASPTANTLTIGSSRFILCSDSQSKFGDNGIINGAATDGNTQIQYFGGKALFFNEGASNTKMTLNSTVLAIGVTPAPWATIKALQVGDGASLFGFTATEATLSGNTYYNGGFKYVGNGQASQYQQQIGEHRWFSAVNNTSGAGAAITFGNAKMTLDASGSLLVGTTTSLQNTSHSFQALGTTNSFWASTFQHDGTVGSPRLLGWRLPNSSDSNAYFVYAINSGGNCFNVFGNGSVNNSTGTYGTISDLRLKENISDARNYLADLLKLRVVKYSLKSEQSAVATKIGFVAQEVEQVFPTLVETNGDDVKSIKTSILIPMLLKAIQELTARVQTLEAK